MFGGGGVDGSSLSDTWTWDGTAWTQENVAGPPGRATAEIGSTGTELVLFGGVGVSNPLFQDTWTWDGASWTQRGGPEPSARCWGVMATQ
jgi:hypothetical protein